MLIVVLLSFLLSAQPPQPNPVVRIAVQGETNLVPNFIETFKAESRALGLQVEIVERRSATLDYNILIAQETTLGSAAAAIVATSRDGDLVASVVRSGRFSGRGAINACTKELAKKIAVFKR